METEKIEQIEEKQEQQQQSEDVIRWSAQQESKIIKECSKILHDSEEEPKEEEILSYPNDYGIMDCANVCMVIPKTNQAKRLLTRFTLKNPTKAPKIEYESLTGESAISKYSIEYSEKIIKILKHDGETIKIKLKRDYPATFETPNLKIILAAQVYND